MDGQEVSSFFAQAVRGVVWIFKCIFFNAQKKNIIVLKTATTTIAETYVLDMMNISKIILVI